MQIKKGDIDFVSKILTCCYEHFRQEDLFVVSLMHQYEERGFLTKGQLQGLFFKAEKVPNLPSGLLATLEFTLKKLPTKEKKNAPIVLNEVKKDEEAELMLQKILASFPQHKAILGLQLNYKRYNKLNPTEKLELTKIYKLMQEKGKI